MPRPTIYSRLTLAVAGAFEQCLPVVVAVLLVLLVPVANAVDEPERATGWHQNTAVAGREQAVVTASPWASRAAWWVLDRGGNALDAAIAAQWVLGLVEPQSSGLGGGAFLLYFDHQQQRLVSYDGREVAPAGIASDDYTNGDGSPRDWWSVVASGKSVGVPGVVAMLSQAHHDHGRLPWRELVHPAVGLARYGVAVTPRLSHLLLAINHPNLHQPGPARDYFFPHDLPLQAGQTLRNPALATTLERLGAEGVSAIYQGPVAEAMVDAVAGQGGHLRLSDLAQYQPRQRPPLCLPWRTLTVCSMGPPSSGGLAVLQIMALWQALPSLDGPFASVAAVHRFSEVSRLAFADRNLHVADPDFEAVPVDRLLDPDYLRARAAQVKEADAGPVASGLASNQRNGLVPELPCTSHLSIVDRDGNVATMTTSIEMGFGSGLMAGGFLLNNQLTDFSLVAAVDGQPAVNRIVAGKRPRSSMAPVVVFDQQGQVRLVIGSPGGSRIIPYVAWAMLAYLDGGYELQAALDLGHVVNLNGDTTELEQGTAIANLAPGLQALGHKVVVRPLDSGIHALAFAEGRWIAAADGRREGLALAR